MKEGFIVHKADGTKRGFLFSNIMYDMANVLFGGKNKDKNC